VRGGARRRSKITPELPAEPPRRPEPRPEISAWSPPVLIAGLRNWRRWGAQALGALRLDRRAFHEAAFDPYATGPGLLILLAAVVVQSMTTGMARNVLHIRSIELIVSGFFGWMLIALAAHAAGRLLGGAGRFTFTARAMAFAATPQLLSVLRLVPIAGPLLYVAVSAVNVLALWMALQESLGLSGRRAALVPFVAVAIVVLAIVVVGLMINGVAVTAEAVLLLMGIAPGP